MIRRLPVLGALLGLLAGALGGCSPGQTQDVRFDPCALVDEAQVSDHGGEPFHPVGVEGGAVLSLCVFETDDGLRSIDLAVVDLARLSEQGEQVDGEAYLAELAAGAGDGPVTELDGPGDGRAILISYANGSQAWAWDGDRVVGAYATGLADADAVAVALLRAAFGTD
jgi:hypothetical protein